MTTPYIFRFIQNVFSYKYYEKYIVHVVVFGAGMRNGLIVIKSQFGNSNEPVIYHKISCQTGKVLRMADSASRKRLQVSSYDFGKYLR